MSEPEFSMANIETLEDVRQTLERINALRGNPNSFALWRSSWEHCMAIQGHPHAMLYHVLHQDPVDVKHVAVSYGWESDTDGYLIAWLEQGPWNPGPDAWDDAHVAFVLVDIVRPEYILPSLALERLLRLQTSGDN
jgi:hypothetical protein